VKLDDLEICLLGAFIALGIVCGLVLLISQEVKKGPGKRPNVRVPRETLWTRTNRYHSESRGDDQQQFFMHDVKDLELPSILRRQAE
jgi:hypothetical protein